MKAGLGVRPYGIRPALSMSSNIFGSGSFFSRRRVPFPLAGATGPGAVFAHGWVAPEGQVSRIFSIEARERSINIALAFWRLAAARASRVVGFESDAAGAEDCAGGASCSLTDGPFSIPISGRLGGSAFAISSASLIPPAGGCRIGGICAYAAELANRIAADDSARTPPDNTPKVLTFRSIDVLAVVIAVSSRAFADALCPI